MSSLFSDSAYMSKTPTTNNLQVPCLLYEPHASSITRSTCLGLLLLQPQDSHALWSHENSYLRRWDEPLQDRECKKPHVENGLLSILCTNTRYTSSYFSFAPHDFLLKQFSTQLGAGSFPIHRAQYICAHLQVKLIKSTHLCNAMQSIK